MTRESVLQLISGKLHNIQFDEAGPILRGEYKFNEAKVGIFYVDFSTQALSSDLDEYLENYISSDYYNNPGYLQWNYYLIFLRDVEVDKMVKSTIEKNDTYARKFILSSDELKRYFEYESSDQEVDTDIISIWKEKLASVELNEVYDNSPYSEAVPRFILGEVNKEPVEVVIDQPADSFLIEKLTTINFTDEYRPYPTQRSFTFGAANLIKGVNGSGKTSLLEGIELVITGKNYKDYSSNEKNNCITSVYNDDEQLSDSYTPLDNAKYRKRDVLWYASGYKTGNELFRAFNKYNFYDSDAAYHLSYDSDIKSLTQYLSSIALGSEFIRIQDRVRGFYERLSKELRDRNNIYRDEDTNLKRAEESLQSFQNSSTALASFSSFVGQAKAVNWLGILPIAFDNDSGLFASHYASIKSEFDSLNPLSASVHITDLKTWKQELEAIKQSILNYNQSREAISKLRQSIDQRTDIFKDDSFKLQFLRQAEKYYKNTRSFELPGLDERIEAIESSIHKLDRSIDLFDEIKSSSVFSADEQYLVYKKRITDERESVKQESIRIKDQIEGLKANLTKLEGIITEIKSLGKEFILNNAQAEACPLCETKYPFEDLKNRIDKVSIAIIGSELISQLDDQLSECNKKIENYDVLINDVVKLEKAITILKPLTGYSTIKLQEIKLEFEQNAILLAQQKIDLITYSELKTTLGQDGLNESQFQVDKSNIETHFPGLSFGIQAKDMFLDTLKNLDEKVTGFTSLNSADKQEAKDIEIRFMDSVKRFTGTENFESVQRLLEFRKTTLEKGIEYFDSIGKLIAFAETESINEVFQKINRLNGEYEKYKKSVSDEKEMTLSKQIIAEATEKLDALKPEIEKINAGLAILNDILTNYSETKILSEFIKNNEEQIQGIFEKIHSPKEFSKIIFNYSANTVLLKRKISEQDVPLTKISTGQRAALSLSIFLALNKKLKRGPNLVLFDDPVSYTDDLNILSFLDYLREIVIHENRQIIFATANPKLANLFTKKFGFLDETEFKTFHLQREIS